MIEIISNLLKNLLFYCNYLVFNYLIDLFEWENVFVLVSHPKDTRTQLYD